MKRRVMLYTVFALLFVFTTLSYGEGRPYLSGYLGYATQTDADASNSPLGVGPDIVIEYDAGAVFGLAAGSDFGNWRAEVEGFYHEGSIDQVKVPSAPALAGDGSTAILAFMLNGYYDIENDSKITPFIGAGVGYGFLTHSLGSTEFDDGVYAYQVGAGVGYDITDTIVLNAAYRYVATTEATIDTGSELEFGSHNFLMGLRVYFD